MKVLELLYAKHFMWLKYIRSFGCNDHTAEDYVHEMYIKLFLYSQKKENSLMYNETELNYFFIYVVLKNMWLDHVRKQRKIITADLNDDLIQDETEYIEDDFDLKNDAVNAWVVNLDLEIESLKEYTREKASLLYFKFIYEKIFLERISISELSREVGITYFSLRNTVLIIKEQIKNEVQLIRPI